MQAQAKKKKWLFSSWLPVFSFSPSIFLQESRADLGVRFTTERRGVAVGAHPAYVRASGSTTQKFLCFGGGHIDAFLQEDLEPFGFHVEKGKHWEGKGRGPGPVQELVQARA